MISLIRRLVVYGWFAFLPLAVAAQQTTTISFTNLNISIPDNDPSGVQTSETIAGLTGNIASLELSLNLKGTPDAFDGDYYIALVNGSDDFAILLNRVGVSGDDSYGYGDNGFDVTFSDSADNDIHFYQNVSYTLNADGQLTGIWQPDGENISPLSDDPSVFDNAANQQTATLSSFIGQTPDGTWTLYLADVDGGGTGELADWSLTIVTAPEPPSIHLIMAALFFAFVVFSKKSVFRRH
jgi:subtilisin-like proprotein convertase family protein